MKKIISVLIVLVFAFSAALSASAAAFSDLQESHWAYSSIMALAETGTINGFEDGTFRPNSTVTRAQFVKMIGKSPVRFSSDFSDMPATHWAYEYVMCSQLEGVDGQFFPDNAITRNDVAVLLWKRAGSPKSEVAPYVVTSQGTNKEAIAWVYNKGLIIGSDGLNLRLNDTLTRAEAASLIVRATSLTESSPETSFIDTVDAKLLQYVYESADLFGDSEYSPSKTITNGEMARAALRFGLEEKNLIYNKYIIKTTFDHEYAKDIYALGTTVLGEDVINAEFADKNATVEDTIAFMCYNAILKSHTPLSYGPKNGYNPEITGEMSELKNICLTFAQNNGISLYANGVINPKNEITQKEFAAILFQLDSICGINSRYDVYKGAVVPANEIINNDFGSYPKNPSDYKAILKGIPNSVYEKSLVINNKKPVDSFDFAREYNFVMTGILREIVVSASSKIDCVISYYPTLANDNGNGYTMRVKCKINSASEGSMLSDIYKLSDNVKDIPLSTGDELYLDILTGQLISDVNMGAECAYINDYIK